LKSSSGIIQSNNQFIDKELFKGVNGKNFVRNNFRSLYQSGSIFDPPLKNTMIGNTLNIRKNNFDPD